MEDQKGRAESIWIGFPAKLEPMEPKDEAPTLLHARKNEQDRKRLWRGEGQKRNSPRKRMTTGGLEPPALE